jgi:fimbrial isopeptide formation D2 family protein/LPXTG-motif cell wall-anchored protein
MSGFSSYTFKITDTPTNLSIDKDTIKVVINKEVKKENSDETEIKSIDITSDLTEKITISNSVLTVDLGEYLFTNKANLTVGSEILVTYKAELTSGALDSSVATNDAKITYSNDPNKTNTGTAIPSTGTEKVYTYSITVNKKSTLGKALSGAKFVLKASDEKYIKVDSTTKAISLVDSKDDATEYTSDENGQFKIEGLKEGTYELVEKEAPEGYSIVSGLIFNIANDDNSTIGNAEPQKVIHTLSKGTNASGNIEIVESSKLEKFELNVIDSKTTILPSTGGIGTTIFTVIGVVLMAGAIIAIVVINKKNNK